jgi:hypothetical protein
MFSQLKPWTPFWAAFDPIRVGSCGHPDAGNGVEPPIPFACRPVLYPLDFPDSFPDIEIPDRSVSDPSVAFW